MFETVRWFLYDFRLFFNLVGYIFAFVVNVSRLCRFRSGSADLGINERSERYCVLCAYRKCGAESCALILRTPGTWRSFNITNYYFWF